MNDEPIKVWEIPVPTKYGDNKPISTKHHREWDKYVRNISGGLTLFAVGRGSWVDPNTKETIEERVIPVRVACTESQINHILKFTKRHYRQRAVLAYEVSQKVIYLDSDD